MKAKQALEAIAAAQGDAQIDVMTLYARLSPSEQLKVTDYAKNARSGQCGVIFATTIAEAGVTIGGVAAVVDTGMQSRPLWSHEDRISDIAVERISKERATQRAGRAGRTAAGTCYRLYPQDDYKSMFADVTPPRLHEVNLEQHVLFVLSTDGDPYHHDYFAAPSREALDAACQSLRDLGFLEPPPSIKITGEGREAARLPFGVRISRCIIAAAQPQLDLNCELEVLKIASLLTVSNRGSLVHVPDQFVAKSGDHVSLLNLFEAYEVACAGGRAVAQQWLSDCGVDIETKRSLKRGTTHYEGLIDRIRKKADDYPVLQLLVGGETDANLRSENIRKALCCGELTFADALRTSAARLRLTP